MKPFSKIRISPFRPTHTSSSAYVFGSPSPSKAKRGKTRPVRVVAVLLGIAVSGLLLPSPARAGGPDSSQPDASTVARARAAFLKTMSSHRPLVRSVTTPLAVPGAGATSLPSVNWSGFADVESGSNTVSSVSGQWVIPYVQCPSGPYRYQDAFIAQWVGIDGATDGTVEQLGSATQCFEGVTYYYVWYEMFPGGTVEEGTVACINNNVDCPQPGDFVSASVTVKPAGATNNYKLSLTDFTRPQESFSVTASCAASTCLDSSAEWVVERPAFELPFGFQILPLVDFFQTGFFEGELTSGGKTKKIEEFQDGAVYDVQMSDDSGSYWLDCVGQRGFGSQLLLTTDANACPAVSPYHGSFSATWDSSF
ncbi:MAG: G1 family glutamic endopeptidase [Candidatus Sulfotelmatobacter sp.]